MYLGVIWVFVYLSVFLCLVVLSLSLCLGVLSCLVRMLHSVYGCLVSIFVSGCLLFIFVSGCIVWSDPDAPLCVWLSCIYLCVWVSCLYLCVVSGLDAFSLSLCLVSIFVSCLVRMLLSGPWQNGSKPQLDFLPDTRYLLQIEMPLLQIPRSIHFLLQIIPVTYKMFNR